MFGILPGTDRSVQIDVGLSGRSAQIMLLRFSMVKLEGGNNLSCYHFNKMLTHRMRMNLVARPSILQLQEGSQCLIWLSDATCCIAGVKVGSCDVWC